MKLHSTVLFVNEIEISKKFYTKILNCTIEHDFGNNIIFKNGLSIWEVTIGHSIAKRLNTEFDSNRFELYFEDEHIEKIYNKLKKLNIIFFQELHEESWGQRTFRFFDPDNHLIEIGEPLPVFINNMHKIGMTPDEIQEKSGVPMETIIKILK